MTTSTQTSPPNFTEAFSALFQRRIEEDFRVFEGVHLYCLVPYVQDLQRGVHSGFSQLLVQALALLHWYHSINLAMHDQKRGIIFGDIMDGAGSYRLRFIFFERTAEQPFNGQGASGTEVRHGQQICRASHIAHRLNPARILHIIPTPLQLRHPTGRAEQSRQMSARGVSPNADVVGIEVIDGSVGAKPTHGSLTIFDLRRKRCSAREAVIDTGYGVSILHQRNSWTSFFATLVPVPTMDANDRWQQT